MPYTPGTAGMAPTTPAGAFAMRAAPMTPAAAFSSAGAVPFTPGMQPRTPAPAPFTPAWQSQPRTPATASAMPFTPAGAPMTPAALQTPAGGGQPFNPAASGAQPFTPGLPDAAPRNQPYTPMVGGVPHTPASSGAQQSAGAQKAPATPGEFFPVGSAVRMMRSGENTPASAAGDETPVPHTVPSLHSKEEPTDGTPLQSMELPTPRLPRDGEQTPMAMLYGEQTPRLPGDGTPIHGGEATPRIPDGPPLKRAKTEGEATPQVNTAELPSAPSA